MQISIIVEFSLLLVFANYFRSLRADSASCRRQVECFICDSREIQECEDARNFPHPNIPIHLCDDYCLKIWTRENDSIAGDDQTTAFRYVRRGCHKILRYHIKKAETCYQHKKHHSDSLCLCATDRCNSSRTIRLKNECILGLIFLFFFR